MAEHCNVAFGRYLRVLRERKDLSLDQVATLSRTFADPITKSYLSRVENGHIGLGLPKLIPLSRIYEIPAEVVLERLELDMVRYTAEMGDEVYLQRVREHIDGGIRSGVRATPTFFINGTVHDASYGLQSLVEAVEAALHK